jgi:deoxycytidylate deaminase
MKIDKDDIQTDKTIIIGFGGPIGSGCTTVSKFLDESNFFPFLKNINYIDEIGSTNINREIFDSKITDLYKEKIQMVGQTYQLGSDTSWKEKLRIKHNELKERLERRQYTYSLKYLLTKENYRKRLRISCSSLIVFDLIRKIKTITNEKNDKKDKINDIKELIKKCFVELSTNSKFFINIYKNVKDFHSHKNKKNKDNIDPKSELSDLIKCFKFVEHIKKELKLNKNYRELMQDFGDNIRSTGNPYIYHRNDWIKRNKKYFQYNSYRISRYIEYIVHYYTNMDKDYKFFMVDSFRNPMCVKYLRNRYPRFFLVSIFASEGERKERLKKIEQKREGDNFSDDSFFEYFVDQDKRDQGDNIIKNYDNFFKQNVNEVVRISDIAINNEKISKDGFLKKFFRHLALIIDPGCTKPSDEEMFMNMAYTMAMKSNCMSRQVGAVIEGKYGYLVGAGWNDVGVGQISCGKRNIKDLFLEEFKSYIESIKEHTGNKLKKVEELIEKLSNEYGGDHYCFCFKDEMSRAELSNKLRKIIMDVDYSDIDDSDSRIIKEFQNKLIKETKKKPLVKRLEYCKALHAEENAIIQGSKIGGMGLIDATMYTTTFPCELCAKKIHQSGIRKVIYVDPYPKSISKDLFLQDGIQHVITEQFEGVKPHSYIKLFKPHFDQKEKQSLIKDGFNDNVI